MADNWKIAALAGKALAEEAATFDPTPRQQAFRDLVEACYEANYCDRTTWLSATRGTLPKTWPEGVPRPEWVGKRVEGKELGDWFRDARFGKWLYANIAPQVEIDTTQMGMGVAVFFQRVLVAMQEGQQWAFPIFLAYTKHRDTIAAAQAGGKEGQGQIDEFMASARTGGDAWKVEA
jgi:hypothetical protein